MNMSLAITNDTTTSDPVPKPVLILHQTISVMMTILIITGNGFCLVVMRKATHMKTVTKIFFMSLLSSNMYVGVGFGLVQTTLLLFGHLIEDQDITYMLCSITAGVSFTGTAASVISLLSINIERYICIEMPLRSAAFVTRKVAAAFMIVKWLCMLTVAIVYSLMFDSLTYYDDNWKMCFTYSGTLNSSIVTYVLVFISILIFLPLIITISIYGRILVLVRRSTQSHVMSAPGGYNTSKGNHKATFTLIMVAFTYIITWIPFGIIVMITILSNDQLYPHLRFLAYLLLLCSHWITVFVFIKRDATFRRLFKSYSERLICHACCKSICNHRPCTNPVTT